MDNWQECTRGCRGTVSRRTLLNTQMGLGHECFDPDLNAWASDFRMTESNYGQFYRRWVQLFGAESWTRMPTGGASDDRTREVEQFLYREARRLSDISTKGSSLFTEDAGYWMGAPNNHHLKTSKAIAILNAARYAKTT
jgi:hypothetical protein